MNMKIVFSKLVMIRTNTFPSCSREVFATVSFRRLPNAILSQPMMLSVMIMAIRANHAIFRFAIIWRLNPNMFHFFHIFAQAIWARRSRLEHDVKGN